MTDFAKDPRTWSTSDLVLAIANIAARGAYQAARWQHEPIGRREPAWQREEREAAEAVQAEQDAAVAAALNARVRIPRLPVQDADLDTILHFLPSEVEDMKSKAQLAVLTWIIDNGVTMSGIEREAIRIRNGGNLRE